jgi:DUF4097 and DUF4098 domain-containing protein YvlB
MQEVETMIYEGRNQHKDKKVYKAILILLIGLAGISGARKDLNQLLSLANDVQALSDQWSGAVLPTVHARTVTTVESCSLYKLERVAVPPDEFHWSGRVDQGKSVEIKGISGDISAEPATGPEIEVVANKTAHRSDPAAVKIQVVEHPGGVTICAIYPSDDPSGVNTCQPGTGNGHSSSATIGVRNNDVRVDFTVRVPQGVGFIGRTINGEIKAASLSGNVISFTVNGSIRISTSGYAEAKTVNGEIVASLGNGNWPNAIEFKTVNGGITLDLPAGLSAQVTADTFNGEIASEFPINLLGVMSRKHLSGMIGGGGRELILKTLNGSINLRRAS